MVGPSKDGFISRGFLEVLVDGVWGAVCSDKWTKTESFVACGNLGYPDIEVGGIKLLKILLQREWNLIYYVFEFSFFSIEKTKWS